MVRNWMLAGLLGAAALGTAAGAYAQAACGRVDCCGARQVEIRADQVSCRRDTCGAGQRTEIRGTEVRCVRDLHAAATPRRRRAQPAPCNGEGCGAPARSDADPTQGDAPVEVVQATEPGRSGAR